MRRSQSFRRSLLVAVLSDDPQNIGEFCESLEDHARGKYPNSWEKHLSKCGLDTTGKVMALWKKSCDPTCMMCANFVREESRCKYHLAKILVDEFCEHFVCVHVNAKLKNS